MVKFGVNYESFIVSQWSQYYVDYEALKQSLLRDSQRMIDQQSSLSTNSSSVLNNMRNNNSMDIESSSVDKNSDHNSEALKSLLDNDHYNQNNTPANNNRQADNNNENNTQADIEANLFKQFNRNLNLNNPNDPGCYDNADDADDNVNHDADYNASSNSNSIFNSTSTNPHILALHSLVRTHESNSPHLTTSPQPHFLRHLVTEITKSVHHHQTIQKTLTEKVQQIKNLTTGVGGPPDSKIQRYNIKILMKDIYSEYNKLESFRSLNTTAILKILKKLTNKFSNLYKDADCVKERVMVEVEEVWGGEGGREEIVQIYKDVFCKGDEREATMEVRIEYVSREHF